MGKKKQTTEERFWVKVDKSKPFGCWQWEATLIKGYGVFWDGSRNVRAHRYAYELLVGPIPEGLTIDHLCRNRACVNPAHMEIVTNKVNVLRSIGITACFARQTYCLRGHEYTPENTYIDKRGYRSCKTCRSLWGPAHREQERERSRRRRAGKKQQK